MVVKTLTLTRVEKTPYNLLKIVPKLEATSILQTNSDRAFVNNVLASMKMYNSSLKIIHFKNQQSQNPGSVENAISDNENMLCPLMQDKYNLLLD